jgi:hypothetical protein
LHGQGTAASASRAQEIAASSSRPSSARGERERPVTAKRTVNQQEESSSAYTSPEPTRRVGAQQSVPGRAQRANTTTSSGTLHKERWRWSTSPRGNIRPFKIQCTRSWIVDH